MGIVRGLGLIMDELTSSLCANALVSAGMEYMGDFEFGFEVSICIYSADGHIHLGKKLEIHVETSFRHSGSFLLFI